jgi:hypothetical protein
MVYRAWKENMYQSNIAELFKAIPTKRLDWFFNIGATLITE